LTLSALVCQNWHSNGESAKYHKFFFFPSDMAKTITPLFARVVVQPKTAEEKKPPRLNLKNA